MFNISFRILILLAGIYFVGIPSSYPSFQPQQQLKLSDSEIKIITDAARNKAKELGYKPDQMNIRLSSEGNLFVVDFYPKQQYENGVVIYGGGITLWIEKSGRVNKFQRQI